MGTAMLAETTATIHSEPPPPTSYPSQEAAVVAVVDHSEPPSPYPPPAAAAPASADTILTQSLISGGLADLLETTALDPAVRAKQQQQEQHQQLQNGGDYINKLIEEEPSRNLTKEELRDQTGPKRAKTG
jgi:hypothetical protein